jgi:hypothetical protein
MRMRAPCVSEGHACERAMRVRGPCVGKEGPCVGKEGHVCERAMRGKEGPCV